MKPRFAHDCENCVFLGSHGQHDLYFCRGGVHPTVIARFGNDGPDYMSGLAVAHLIPELAEAERRARLENLLPPLPPTYPKAD